MFDRTVTVLGVVALTNFAAFVLIAMHLGGDAINGHEEGGRYFLANHGQLTEVSRSTFLYSTWHAISVGLTHGAFILSAAVNYLTEWARRDRP